MPNPDDQYLVASRGGPGGAAAVAQFQEALKGFDGAGVVSGDPARHLVVRMPVAAFEALRKRFGAELIIEPNSPLTL